MNTIKNEEVKMLRLFKSSIANCRYVFKDGKVAAFLAGEYRTDDAKEINELEEEVHAKHPFIYIDENNWEVPAIAVDPLEEIRKKAVAEYIASQANAANLPDSESDQQFKVAGIANSSTVGSAMSGSTSTDAGVQSAQPAAGAQVVSQPANTASVMQSKLAALKAGNA